jgi:hypothetical protein
MIQTVQSSKQKIMKQLAAAFVVDIVPEESFRPSQFHLDEKIDRGFTDTPNPGIHNLAYLPNLCQRPAFRATPTQSRKIVLRPVNIKDFGILGVGRGTEPRFNLWPSLQPRSCYFSETTKM